MITLHGQLDWLDVPVCLFPERRGGVTECGHQTTEEERERERAAFTPAS